MTNETHFPVVVVTGLSGAGKSTVLNVFEDQNFFTVDGLPVGLISKLVDLFTAQSVAGYRGLAVGMDLRQSDFLKEWNLAVGELESLGIRPQVLFVEARSDVLLRRYSTTRRPHPLETRTPGLEHAIDAERQMLEPVRDAADMVLDTSEFSIHDLRRKIQDKWLAAQGKAAGLRVHIISFGFKYGVPSEADLVFDLRFLPNPYFDETLRPLSGKDKAVADYVLASDPGATFITRFIDFLAYLLPPVRKGRPLPGDCGRGVHRGQAPVRGVCGGAPSGFDKSGIFRFTGASASGTWLTMGACGVPLHSPQQETRHDDGRHYH